MCCGRLLTHRRRDLSRSLLLVIRPSGSEPVKRRFGISAGRFHQRRRPGSPQVVLQEAESDGGDDRVGPVSADGGLVALRLDERQVAVRHVDGLVHHHVVRCRVVPAQIGPEPRRAAVRPRSANDELRTRKPLCDLPVRREWSSWTRRRWADSVSRRRISSLARPNVGYTPATVEVEAARNQRMMASGAESRAVEDGRGRPEVDPVQPHCRHLSALQFDGRGRLWVRSPARSRVGPSSMCSAPTCSTWARSVSTGGSASTRFGTDGWPASRPASSTSRGSEPGGWLTDPGCVGSVPVRSYPSSARTVCHSGLAYADARCLYCGPGSHRRARGNPRAS